MNQLIHMIKVFNTIKYLKFKQIFFRIYYRFKKVSLHHIPQATISSWIWSGPHLNQQSILSDTLVSFLNQTGEVTGRDSWNSPSKSKLWLYNLHYFDDLSSVNYFKRKNIHFLFINKWIRDNPPCIGNGWEPYPISLRLVNWIKWFSQQEYIDKCYSVSLYQQAEALYKQVEYHILGNHIFSNAKALIFAGCFFQNKEANKFFELGINILKGELKEQFLDDGAHFELSPMYHSIMLWDLLELIELSKLVQKTKLVQLQNTMRKIAIKSLSWLDMMTHPDGEISFFNDSSFGVAKTPIQIKTYAHSLGLSSETNMEDLITEAASGYSCVRRPFYKLIIDHGKIGPDYLPGHAHADTLSFELSVFDLRVFVNSGTSVYGIGSERHRQRQTMSHNTVVVDDTDSSEVWAGFRVAKRAYGKLLNSHSSSNGKTTLAVSHDGYRFLKPKQIHTRYFSCSDDVIEIKDVLSSVVGAKALYHLHPDILIQRITDYCIKLTVHDKGTIYIESDSYIEVHKSTWHPEFGVAVETSKLVIQFKFKELNIKMTLIKDEM